MLDTTALSRGDKCYYKGKPLIYQRTVTSSKVPPYHVFKDRSGKEKRLSEPITARDVWIEIFVGVIANLPE